jgi:hypothetical protein
LRRWANPARTTSKRRAAGTSDGATAGPSGRRTIDTNAESTFGWGTNTVGGTFPTTRAVAQYATFTDTAP